MAHPQQNINKTRPLVERFGLESVPSNLRTTSSVEYAMIQIAISVNAGNVLVPALAVLEGGLSFFYAVLSTVVGAAAAFLFVSFLALPGAKYGIPAQYAIRSIMGVKGARYIASPVRTVTSLYWFAVQTIGGTYLLKELIEKTFHIQVPVISLALLMATIMAILALVGFEAVKKVTKYFLPILFIGSITMLFIFLTTDSKSIALQTEATNQLSAMLFFSSLAFVQYISGVSSSSDMARYAQSSNQAFYGLLTGNILGFTLTAILGAYAATMAGSVNPYVISSHLTDSKLLIIIIFIAAMASMIMINISNAYTGGYSLLNSFPSLGRVKSAVIFGLFAILLSGFPALVDEAKFFISLMGALIIPLSAVIVADFLFVKNRELSTVDIEGIANESYLYNRAGLISILIGMGIYLSIPESLSPGFVAFIFAGITYLIMLKKLFYNK